MAHMLRSLIALLSLLAALELRAAPILINTEVNGVPTELEVGFGQSVVVPGSIILANEDDALSAMEGVVAGLLSNPTNLESIEFFGDTQSILLPYGDPFEVFLGSVREFYIAAAGVTSTDSGLSWSPVFIGGQRISGSPYDTWVQLTPVPAQVPEPSTLALIGVGLLGLVFVRRRAAWRSATFREPRSGDYSCH